MSRTAEPFEPGIPTQAPEVVEMSEVEFRAALYRSGYRFTAPGERAFRVRRRSWLGRRLDRRRARRAAAKVLGELLDSLSS